MEIGPRCRRRDSNSQIVVECVESKSMQLLGRDDREIRPRIQFPDDSSAADAKRAIWSLDLVGPMALRARNKSK